MKSSLLFPPVFRIIGFVLAVPGLVLGYLFEHVYYDIPFFRYGRNHMWNGADTLTDEVAITLVVTGLFLIGFSKLKHENKVTTKLRLDALYWSVLVICLVVSVYLITVFFGEVLKVPFIKQHNEFGFELIEYNFFIPLLIFILRFYYLLQKRKVNKKGRSFCFLPSKPYNILGKIGSILFIVLSIMAITSSILSINRIFEIEFSWDMFVGFPPFLLLWIWSKEKNEIAHMKNIRLKAMQIAVYINYSLVLLTTWLLYGFDYGNAMFVGSISIQIIFLLIFYYQLYQLRKKHTKIAITTY